MHAADLEQEILSCFSKLNRNEQQSVLAMIKTFVSNREEDLKPVTIDEYNSELEKVNEEIESGDFILHDDIKKKYS